MYRGQMRDGLNVTIRCLIMKRSNTTQNFMHHIELISKLRYCHLVSALGHCFECYLDDSSVSRIFLVFEYVPNGTLRSWISGNYLRSINTSTVLVVMWLIQMLSWIICLEIWCSLFLTILFADRHGRQKLTWTQRIAAATGVAKGLQFLHNGIVPGIFSNNLKITDIMLDQNLVAKISSYNLPILSENVGKVWRPTSQSSMFILPLTLTKEVYILP